MKRRHIALLAAASVAASALLAGTPALAVAGSARVLPAREVGAVRGDGPSSVESGLVTRLKGVPETFVAGGAWEEFDLVLDNISQGEISDFTSDMQVITIIPDPALHPSHMSVQVLSGGSWVDTRLQDMGARDVNVALPVRPMVLPPGKTTIRLRTKFSADAPSVELYLGPQPDEQHATGDEDYWVTTRIVHRDAPSPDPSTDPEPSREPGPDPDPSTGPGPDPSADPEPSTDPDPDPGSSMDPGPGPSATPGPSAHPLPAPEPTGSDSALSGGAGQAAASGAEGGAEGGGLAHTGSNAATKWALGAGGTLIVLGAGLAVAGRQARRWRAHR
ncbi:hypothetical protein ACFY9H_05115 [Streptomyces bacillaris]|uniref:hypothetical protein n=1 Tax=Streptomyces TaxID=1883 RepID=UPI0015866591|nr:hypothetical protein [Streptomyces sp. CAI-24]NUV39609.1 hypothetical protein [Streptomyces sp. CAI-24]